MSRTKLLITTAIDYVNGKPHIGHSLEKIQADVIARYNRQKGRQVLFLTGTDENSLKNVRAAEKEGMSAKEFVDKNAGIFYSLKTGLDLSFDDFIRTTQERHIKGSQKLWLTCKKDIYKAKYKGLYCVGCEAYYTEADLENGLCKEHKTKPEIIEEENYFFRLSKYEKDIKKALKSGKVEIIPQSRKNEILSFVESGLEDICVSRSKERANGWGIDVPDDPSQKIWCWFDALSNYITALDYADNGKKFKEFWQKGEAWHFIGKGISRFHAVYWLGILLSGGLKLPDKIFIHGYINVNSQKMSKSLGNVINPFELVERYAEKIGNREAALDALRYFLLREISSTEDGDFTYEKFDNRYNADLANGLGNLTARVLTLAGKLKVKEESFKLKGQVNKTKKQSQQFLEDFKFNEALSVIWELIGFCDKYVNETKPWEGKENAQEVIGDLLFALKEIADMLLPFLPKTAEKIQQQIKSAVSWPLFPRI